MTTHQLDMPCPIDAMRTLCGETASSKKIEGHLVAMRDDQVDCEDCLRWMVCRGYVRPAPVPP